MSLYASYRMRLRRQRRIVRAYRKARQLRSVLDQTQTIKPDDILLISTIRNERIRLPYFLRYYRERGVSHFLFIDNNSVDGTHEDLAQQSDVSVWHTSGSYKRASFGVDWVNYLLRKYGHGHWCLTVDPDEFFVYPFCDTRPIRALTDWLDASDVHSFSAMLLDMYPKGPVNAQPYLEGQDPFEVANWFDSGNYTYKYNPYYGNLWIQGGARSRVFFPENPARAPALNKIPLVKWHRRYAYVSSTHMLLPRKLNKVFDRSGGEMASGMLLHAKFLNLIGTKAQEEMSRRQHYGASREYIAYAENLHQDAELWCNWSERYINWRQLEILGLLSKGNWA